jgi:effector-binding domain-containing protein
MTYDVCLSTALPRPLAAVRQAVVPSEIPAVIQGLLGEVWQLLRDNDVRSTGHNVALYTESSRQAGAPLDARFGVETHETIPASDRVFATSTPGGPVASVVHWGEYSSLGAAHDAVRAWCAANGKRITGTAWEVYGDWADDWAKVRTDVYYLLHS